MGWTVSTEQKKPTSLVPLDGEGEEKIACQNSLKHFFINILHVQS